jgi:hypothetical protein
MGNNCNARHTKFQPKDEEWKCPVCGSGSDVFYIDDSANGASDECGLLHVHDSVLCETCGRYWAGGTLAATMVKENNLSPCLHCKGTGFVQNCNNVVQKRTRKVK